MNKLFFCALLFLSYEFASAQFHYDLTSIPDSAKVTLNGETECYTPCRVKFYWRKAENGKLIVAVQAPGFEPWADTLRKKPSKFNFKHDAELKRKLPVFDDLDSITALVAFDKLLADFKDGTTVGKYKKSKDETETIKWEGNIKIGESGFEETFYEIVTNAGFTTPLSEFTSLFSDDSDKRKPLPRFIVGANLAGYDVYFENTKKKSYGAGKKIGITKMTIEWQVLDKKSGDVVLKKQTEGKIRYRTGRYYSTPNNLMAFEDALIDFLNEGSFRDLLKNADSSPIVNSVSVKSGEEVNIEKKELPEFATSGEMINYASKSCVTIITDGGHGSGVIVGKDGYVLSAYHVVDGVNKIQVQFSEGLQLNAEVLAYDQEHDIVLLKIVGSGFQALPLGVDREFSLGEDVVTIGTPANVDLGQSVAKGILSGKRLVEENIYYQIDISVSPGNSGGPLLNKKGEVIGIVQRKIISEGVEGIGFAVPVKTAVEILNIQVDK
ncbi:MAG: trypsin-like peptidase domain-containing protein [Chitinophagales bacterium]